MVGTNVKQETMTLMEKRTAIEAELEVIISRLCGPNGPGLTGNLVDKDGFPRADIDISAVRAERQRLSVLRNDHKEATSKIEQNLHILHSGAMKRDSSLPQKRTAYGEESRPQRSSFVAQSSESAITNGADVAVHMEEDPQPRVPFAVFDEVSARSPAEQDGVMLGDLLVKFGRVQGGDNLLSRLALEGQQNQGSAIQVAVLRQGVPVHLNLTPRQWSGRGLLGWGIGGRYLSGYSVVDMGRARIITKDPRPKFFPSKEMLPYPPTVTVPSLTRVCVTMLATGKRYFAVLGVHHFDQVLSGGDLNASSQHNQVFWPTRKSKFRTELSWGVYMKIFYMSLQDGFATLNVPRTLS